MPKGQSLEISRLYGTMDYISTLSNLPSAEAWLRDKINMKCFIDGNYIFGDGTQEVVPIKDACTLENVTQVGVPLYEDVLAAIQSSGTGRKMWSSIESSRKSKIIEKIAHVIQSKKTLIAEIESLTVGTSPSAAKQFDVQLTAQYFEYYATWCYLIPSSERRMNGLLVYTITEPLPIPSIAAFLATALVTGNSVIINPIIEAPLAAFLMAEICLDAGVCPGIVNVIPGSLDHMIETVKEHIDGYILCGSKEPSIKLSSAPCPVSKVGFSKSLAVVLESADIPSSVDILLKHVDFSYRQHPLFIKTILVQESSFDFFIEDVRKKLQDCTVGHVRAAGVDIGLPIMKDEELKNYLDSVLEYCSKRSIEIIQVNADHNLFYPPTVLVGTDSEINAVTKNYKILPFVSIIPFRTIKEVTDIVNKTHFGAVSLWTESLSITFEMVTQIKTGMLWVNTHGKLHPSVPCSLWKERSIVCAGGHEGLAQHFLLTTSSQYVCDNACQVEDVSASVLQEEKVQRTSFVPIFDYPLDRQRLLKVVSTSNQGQAIWWQLGAGGRSSLLLKVPLEFETNYKGYEIYFPQPIKDAREIKSVLTDLYKCAAKPDKISSVRCEKPVPNSMVQMIHEPLGIIGIMIDDTTEFEPFVKCVMNALVYGNSLLIFPNLQYKTPILEFCETLKCVDFPNGLINVLILEYNTIMEVIQECNILWYIGNDRNEIEKFHKQNREKIFVWHCPNRVNDHILKFASSCIKTVWYNE